MRKMTKGMLMTALILGAVAAQGNAYAAGPEFVLDEMVVTASRMETKLLETPANVTIIDADKLASRHYQNVAEALKDVPGAIIIDNGTGANEKKIVLNGDDRVLVLVDGRRVGFDMGVTSGNASYDLNQMPDVSRIERIEVVKGASGALYGSDAVGGVVNIITKKMDANYGKLAAAFGSYGAQDLKAVYAGKEGKTGFSVDLSKYEQDYYKYKDVKTDTTMRRAGKSDFENKKVGLKIEQELTDNSILTIGYDYSKYKGYYYNSWGKKNEYTDKKTDNIYGKYDWNLENGDSGYFQYYHNEVEYENQGGMEEKTNGIDLQQEFTLNDKNRLVVGTSWREAKASNEKNYPDGGKIKNLSIFVSDVWNIQEDLAFSAGVRYDDHNKAGDETTWNFGLNKVLNDDSHIYANWGQVFKAPTIDDLYYHSDEYGGYYGNPDAKAETGESWTVGYGAQLNDKTNMDISYFESDLEDALDWYSNGSFNTIRNIDKQKKRGMEVSVDHEINDNVVLEASYTYVKVRNNDAGAGYERDDNQVPNIYRFGVNYKDGQWDSTLSLRAGSGASAKKYVDSSYVTMDLAVSYQQSENLSFYAKAYNLFNEAYAECPGLDGMGGYSNPAMSRRFILGAEYTF